MSLSSLKKGPQRRDPDDSPARSAFDSSGRRWTLLGTLLIAVMAAATVMAHHNPWAIAGIFMPIPAILRAIPAIMDARAKTLDHDRETR